MKCQFIIDSWSTSEWFQRLKVVFWRFWWSATMTFARFLCIWLVNAGVSCITVGVGWRWAYTVGASARAHLTRVHAQMHVIGIVQVDHILRYWWLWLLFGIVQLIMREVFFSIWCIQFGLVENFLKVDEWFRILKNKV